MKHLPTSAAAVLHHNNDFLYSNLTQYLIELPKPSKTNMKKMYQIHNIFKNVTFNLYLPKYKEAFGPKNPK